MAAVSSIIAAAAVIGAGALTKSAIDSSRASKAARKDSKRESARLQGEQDELKRSIAMQEEKDERTRLRDERRARARSVISGGRQSTILSGPLGDVGAGPTTGKTAIGD